MPPDSYPVRLTIAFPEDGVSRISTLFRFILMIPGYVVAIVLASVAAIVWPVLALIILFTGSFPKRLFSLYVDVFRFNWKQSAYILLLTDRWAFDTDDHPVEVSVSYPPEGRLSRWLPLVKWLLALPHLLCLNICYLFAFVLLPILWIYILATGRMARSLFEVLAILLVWDLQASAYVYSLTDKYPPFGGK